MGIMAEYQHTVSLSVCSVLLQLSTNTFVLPPCSLFTLAMVAVVVHLLSLLRFMPLLVYLEFAKRAAQRVHHHIRW